MMNQKQQKALAALLTSPRRAKAAETAGVTTRTLQNYLSDPQFQAEYKKAFGNMVADAARTAQQALAPALSTLREIVESENENAQARISAARSILEYSMKLTETVDILSRLEQLEEEIEHGQ